jgi:hypothetical protein
MQLAVTCEGGTTRKWATNVGNVDLSATSARASIGGTAETALESAAHAGSTFEASA